MEKTLDKVTSAKWNKKDEIYWTETRKQYNTWGAV